MSLQKYDQINWPLSNSTIYFLGFSEYKTDTFVISKDKLQGLTYPTRT